MAFVSNGSLTPSFVLSFVTSFRFGAIHLTLKMSPPYSGTLSSSCPSGQHFFTKCPLVWPEKIIAKKTSKRQFTLVIFFCFHSLLLSQLWGFLFQYRNTLMSLCPNTQGTLVSCFIANNWCFAGDSQEQHVSCQLRCPKETKVHAPRFLLTPDAYLSLDRKPEISRLIPSTRQKLNIPFHLKISLYNFVMSLDSPLLRSLWVSWECFRKHK